jgi:shikimate dehydrogenase/3-dehydroquinate dehydratase type I
MICIPITAASHKEALRDIERSCSIVDFIELRMDLISDGLLPDLISAARGCSGSVKIIVTSRKKEEAAAAGEFLAREAGTKDTSAEKTAMLKKAIDCGADYVDIELSEGGAAIEELKSYCEKLGGKTKIIVSYHNIKMTPTLTRLKEIFNRCAKTKPAIVKIVTLANTPEDNLKVLSLIPYARKNLQDIIALCMGDEGRISRVVAPFLGNYLSFATLEQGVESAPGQLTIQEMKQINKLVKGEQPQRKALVFPALGGHFQNYVLLGNPVAQSLSPLMHNAALDNLGVEGHYNAFCVSDLEAAVMGIRGMNIRGAGVTIPFKIAVMELLDDVHDDALKIGAVNTIINNNGRLTGFNTDWLGLILTLKEVMPIKGKKFVIIGAGGTTRAAVYGIMKEGGFPIIVNRTAEKGKILSAKLNCPFYSLAEIGEIKADCLINTTPVGMYPYSDKSPVDAAALVGYKYVMDVIYNPLKTKLLKDAEQLGCHIFPGLDMFVHQGAEQIKLWTGKEPNRALMKKVVLERLAKVE